jgi:hypothetical protein
MASVVTLAASIFLGPFAFVAAMLGTVVAPLWGASMACTSCHIVKWSAEREMVFQLAFPCVRTQSLARIVWSTLQAGQ